MAVFMTFYTGERGKLGAVGRMMQRKGFSKGVYIYVFAMVKNKGF
jgi:hypothetical protein